MRYGLNQFLHQLEPLLSESLREALIEHVLKHGPRLLNVIFLNFSAFPVHELLKSRAKGFLAWELVGKDLRMKFLNDVLQDVEIFYHLDR